MSSNNTKWEYEWTSTRRPVTNPVTGRRTSTERPVTAWIAMRKGVTGKEFTLTSWKTEIAKCRRARTTWTLCKRRTGEAIPRGAKFGRIVFLRDVNRETITDTLSFCDIPRINPWNLWNRCFKWLRGWSWIRHKLLDWPRLTGSSPVERDYFVNWLPKPTSFLTQCCLVASVVHQFRPGQTKTNGIWKRAISKTWIELTENRWSSSGQFSQDSLRWEFSTKFKRWWRN